MIVKGYTSCGAMDHKISTSKKYRYVARISFPLYTPPGMEFAEFVKAKPSDSSVAKSCPSCGGTDHQKQSSKKCPHNRPLKIVSSVV